MKYNKMKVKIMKLDSNKEHMRKKIRSQAFEKGEII